MKRILVASIAIITAFSIAGMVQAWGDMESHTVPHWIRNNAVWWHDGEISDKEFTNEMKWLIEHKVIYVRDFHTDAVSDPALNDCKNIAYYWSKGRIPDAEFTNTLEYMVRNGVIKLDTNFVSETESERFLQAEVAHDGKKSVVIEPIFTAIAYSQNGFYSYFLGQCDASCLSKTISSQEPLGYTSSRNGVQVLRSMGYDIVSDIDVDQSPKILSKYDKVIVLHNEYVTQKEFDAITSHHHVVYLFPNALYAKVEADYKNNTITLVRGHSYPSHDIRNGFDWKYDNSHFEYDVTCSNWNFTAIDNGVMLNCYPENHLAHNFSLLKVIKDY